MLRSRICLVASPLALLMLLCLLPGHGARADFGDLESPVTCVPNAPMANNGCGLSINPQLDAAFAAANSLDADADNDVFIATDDAGLTIPLNVIISADGLSGHVIVGYGCSTPTDLPNVTFPVGVTTVTCSETQNDGMTASASFTFTVLPAGTQIYDGVDGTPIEITLEANAPGDLLVGVPAPQSMELPFGLGRGTVTCTDNPRVVPAVIHVGGPYAISCEDDFASGAIFSGPPVYSLTVVPAPAGAGMFESSR